MDTFHPAVRAVVEATGHAELRLRAVAIRDDEAVAVVMENNSVRRTVIVERREGQWPLPSMIGERRRNWGSRPQHTTAWSPFFDHAVSQSGWPDESGGRPEVAWQAVPGFAAEDARTVAVVTAHDAHESEVGADGSFVTLARAAWGGRRPRCRSDCATVKWSTSSCRRITVHSRQNACCTTLVPCCDRAPLSTLAVLGSRARRSRPGRAARDSWRSQCLARQRRPGTFRARTRVRTRCGRTEVYRWRRWW